MVGSLAVRGVTFLDVPLVTRETVKGVQVRQRTKPACSAKQLHRPRAVMAARSYGPGRIGSRMTPISSSPLGCGARVLPWSGRELNFWQCFVALGNCTGNHGSVDLATVVGATFNKNGAEGFSRTCRFGALPDLYSFYCLASCIGLAQLWQRGAMGRDVLVSRVPPGSRPDAIGTLFNKIGEVTGPNTAALGMLFNKAGEGVQDPLDSRIRPQISGPGPRLAGAFHCAAPAGGLRVSSRGLWTRARL